jgi:hypothetical protein
MIVNRFRTPAAICAAAAVVAALAFVAAPTAIACARAGEGTS